MSDKKKYIPTFYIFLYKKIKEEGNYKEGCDINRIREICSSWFRVPKPVLRIILQEMIYLELLERKGSGHRFYVCKYINSKEALFDNLSNCYCYINYHLK